MVTSTAESILSISMLPSAWSNNRCRCRLRATPRTRLVLSSNRNSSLLQKSPSWTQQKNVHKQKTPSFHHQRKTPKNNTHRTIQRTRQQNTPYFGVVAALTKNNVIGINHSLPWNVNAAVHEITDDIKKDMLVDRNRFIQLTKNKIIILGRNTFLLEDPTGKHVEHARMCIVISRSLDRDENTWDWIPANKQCKDGNGENHAMSVGTVVKVVRSFQEALELARDSLACEERANDNKHDDDKVHEVIDVDESENENLHGYDKSTKSIDTQVDLWVCGGEKVFTEALLLPLAKEVHLTHVDMVLDVDDSVDEVLDSDDHDKNQKSTHVAYFPINLLKENKFEEVSRCVHGICTFCLYKKL
ncbi:hypothetical protein ACHAXS_012684 [Conticribra weissflogii]